MNEIISQFYLTPLIMAIKRENIEIVENLLSNEKIDVNIFGIFNFS